MELSAHDINDAVKDMGASPASVARAVSVLELVAHGSVGLGEVLQDYAAQGSVQLRALMAAAAALDEGSEPGPSDREAAENADFTLKMVKSVLEMIPSAMQRNKSEMLGEKEKLSRADIQVATDAFLHCPAVARLIKNERSAAIISSTEGIAATSGSLLNAAQV